MYESPFMISKSISSLSAEVSESLSDYGIINLSSFSGEDFRMAFESGQVLLDGGKYIPIRQNGIYDISNIAGEQNIDLYFAKIAGVVTDYIKLELWRGLDTQVNYGEPDVTVLDTETFQQSFDMTGYAKFSITTESGEEFRASVISGAVAGADSAPFAPVRLRGVWQMSNINPDPDDPILVYLAKPSGIDNDYFKIETWEPIT